MAITQDDIDALETKLVNQGDVQQSAIGDQSVTFTALKDRLELLAYFKRQVRGSVTRIVSTFKGV